MPRSSNVSMHTLPNGFRVIYEKSANVLPITSIQLLCDVGSVYEPPKLRGVSHFIEHMVFKGTKNIPDSRTLYKYFDKQGAYFNAATYKRYTIYNVKCNDTFVNKAVEILADILMNSVFDKKEYRKELDVVIEENIKNVNDYENSQSDAIDKMLYEGSNYQYPIDCIEYHRTRSLPHKDVIKYYNTFYHPNNMILSIVSNQPIKTIMSHIMKSYFASKNNGADDNVSHQSVLYMPIVTQTEPKYDIQSINKSDATYLTVAFRTCSQYSKDKYVLNMLKRILGGFFSSRLFLVLREDNGLTYRSSITTQYCETSGSFIISAITNHDTLIKHGAKQLGVLPLIIKMLNDLLKNGVSQTELTLAKNYNQGSTLLDMEDIDNIAVHNAEHLLLYSDKTEFVPYSKVFETYYAPITTTEIFNVIQTYIRKANMNVSVYGSENPKINIIKKECAKLLH